MGIWFGIPNISFFDSHWAAVHFGSGLLIGIAVITYYQMRKKSLTGLRFWRISFIALLLWEYFEILLRFFDRYTVRVGDTLQIFLPNSFFEIESITNIMSDLILGSVGLLLAYEYWKTGRNSK